MLANMRDKKRAKAIIASRAAVAKRKWLAEQREASRKAEEEEEEAAASATDAQSTADDETHADVNGFTPRKRTRLSGPATATRRTSLAADAASPSRSPSPLPAAAAASSASSASAHVTPTKKMHWRTAAKLAAAEAAAASPTSADSASADSDAGDEAAASSSGSSSVGSSSSAAASSSAASTAGSSADAAATPAARSHKSVIAIQRARETRERKAAIAAQRAATRAATMKKKAEAKAAGIILPLVGKTATAVSKSQTAAGACSSSASSSVPSGRSVCVVAPIPTPSYRIVDIHKLAAVLNKFVVGGEVEDMSDKAFSKRHRELERDEAQIREEERRDSIVRWAICDAVGCRKWRVLAKNCGIPSDPSVQWYCGALTSRNGGKPLAKHCAPLDDWIIKCVGERLAKELAAAGITTVALFESKDKGNLAAYSARMRKLGIYYDAQTQTLCKY